LKPILDKHIPKLAEDLKALPLEDPLPEDTDKKLREIL